MSDSHVSGNCMLRALLDVLPVHDVLPLLYSEIVEPDKFYSSEERRELVKKMKFRECTYTDKDIEARIEKEMKYRDKSPLPKGYYQRKNHSYGKFIWTDDFKVILGEYPEEMFEMFFYIFLPPSKIEAILKNKMLVPGKMYDRQILQKLALYLKDPYYPFAKLVCLLQFFLEMPDIHDLFGNNLNIKWTSQCHDHNYTFSSKVARIREEVILAQKQTPPYVAKFYAVVLERVLNDHYIYETAHFEKRMVLLDRLQQLPTGTKGKGAVKHELVIINKQNQYEINMEQLKKVHLMVRLMMDTKSGKEFMEAFCDHMQTTFPGRADGNKASKPALLFAEKFFVWAADTLEFEKGLVEPLKSMYTFGAIPPNKKISIRVMHSAGPNKEGPHIAFVFLDELHHELRKFERAFGGNQFNLNPPIHPGPTPIYATTMEAALNERNLRQLTGDRVIFEPVPVRQICIGTSRVTLLTGPFNRHVVSPHLFFDTILTILVDELRLGIQLLPSNPKVAEFLEKYITAFPAKDYGCFVEIRAMIELKKEAYALKKYMEPPCGAPSVHNLGLLKLDIVPLFNKLGYPEEYQRTFLRRVTLCRCFPEAGLLVHAMYCSGEFCIFSTMPGFRPFYGPPTEAMKDTEPTVRCYGPADRDGVWP